LLFPEEEEEEKKEEEETFLRIPQSMSVCSLLFTDAGSCDKDGTKR
jgi:hypothetical protein